MRWVRVVLSLVAIALLLTVAAVDLEVADRAASVVACVIAISVVWVVPSRNAVDVEPGQSVDRSIVRGSVRQRGGTGQPQRVSRSIVGGDLDQVQ